MSNDKKLVTVTVTGEVGTGKSAICGEIEILCKALGLQVEWNDDGEKRMTHADWTEALEMYKPSVRIVELSPKQVRDAGREGWHSAILAECTSVEGCYQESDPAKTVRDLIDWHRKDAVWHHSKKEESAYERMFHAACASIGEISEALNIPEEEAESANGNTLILEKIKELAAGRVAASPGDQSEPVAWMHPSGGVIQTRRTGLEKDTYTIPLCLAATPAPVSQPTEIFDWLETELSAAVRISAKV